MGICISDEAKFIHILVANTRADIRKHISPCTLFANTRCRSNESLKRSQESACEVQFLLVTENLCTHCLRLIAPVLGKGKKNTIFTIKRCYRGSHREDFIVTL